ncbi:uncharacterized protein si:ch73-204p21.2 [Melanotaenia boesemani]|uniref:uncharacterized protein si:ch73-204p21.2 n=1 Tax=Melanotaenia boesemani TaxID=1250792 RepID=UPI001C03D80C|nr:uncharacterized protein si:ch73-204p21.2 [Melanotaenia boesemani]XP_041849917.1 uncharacterized protein si:ch73-204p21.2 [Melanotaenia boesemani]
MFVHFVNPSHPVSMAAVGEEVTIPWFLSAGLVSIFILILLAVFLTALCSDCTRRSFELQDLDVDKNPSTLIRVVKLEEVHENPTITEIQKDEREFHPEEETPASFSPCQSQQGEPQTLPDPLPEEGNSVGYTPWRSHLMAQQSKGINNSSPSDSAHNYQTIAGGCSTNSDSLSPPANHKPAQQQDEDDRLAARTNLSDCDRNSV